MSSQLREEIKREVKEEFKFISSLGVIVVVLCVFVVGFCVGCEYVLHKLDHERPTPPAPKGAEK